jgi:hypothetical protein
MGFLSQLFADKRDIRQLIFDLAEHGSRPKDLAELYRRLRTMEVYVKIVASDIALRSGPHKVGPNETVKLKSGILPNGQEFVEFFVDKNDDRLRPTFGGMQFREACQMALRSPDIFGLMIRNRAQSWVALPKEELTRILSASKSKFLAP